MIPTYRDILAITVLTWQDQLSDSSIITPRKRVSVFLSIGVWEIFIFALTHRDKCSNHTHIHNTHTCVRITSEALGQNPFKKLFIVNSLKMLVLLSVT